MATNVNAQLHSLTNLITTSVHDIISVYASVGQTVPSLDSLEPGPFDGAVEDVPERLVRAIKIIEAACTQLVCTVSSPSGLIYNATNGHAEPSALLVVTQARIADILVDKPEGLHVDQLAEASGFKDADKLGRLMRLLASRHVFREVKPNVYVNNRLSAKFISKYPMCDIVGLQTDEGMRATAYLYETYTTEPRVPNETPLQRAYGVPLFDWYKLPENKDKGERFNRAMVALGDVYGKGFLAKSYPWGEFSGECTICDIAGGNGHVTMRLLKKHPQFKVVLQDQAEVIEQAKEYWAKEHPQALADKKVEFVPFNFLENVAVAGCDVYYMKSILKRHDWPDAECRVILQNVRKAMKPGARLVIHEIAIHSPARFAQRAEERAPEPLLPNWGASAARTYEADIRMMKMFNAKERTLEELTTLWHVQFSNLGLYPAGEMDLVEFVAV
ncbi:S-adenosyl-L-methionine-dependent methyltransferase [Moniliophthora roreri MCA 2997]|uniref:S-adenosyl-L-methionine-dependent methyltransferase n=1 Tax=Moniliophthora roreri (strain MCA 2997) TaxID=1381753 RepID=V2WFQ8_MONRO|nr:S-adenosyl-L-methionine-dependent methyltransferase [Moniliophthora roreri MCA 2997]